MAGTKTTKPAAKSATKTTGKPGTAVQTVKKESTAVAQPLEMSELFAQHAGQGLERAGIRDFALPFLQVLQKLNPQVDEDSDKYIEGAKPGMILNTVTSELFDEIDVIPCDFHKVYNEWVPRDEGGGFIASHETQQQAEESCEEGHQIVETANHYVLYRKDDGTWQPAILSLTSTKLKASRNWNSQIAQRTINTEQGKKIAPSFACIYTVSTVSEENDKGKYYTIKVNAVDGPEGWVNDPQVFQQAVTFREQIKMGIAKVDFKSEHAATAGGGDDDGRY